MWDMEEGKKQFIWIAGERAFLIEERVKGK